MSTFETLNAVNVNGHTEKKKTGNAELTYLSWPWAIAEVKKRFEDVSYEIKKDENGLPYVYDEKTGYMVYTTVTIEGITHEMWLPVMDGANNAMKAEPYSYSVKNPYFRYAKQDKEGVWRDKYGNEQPEYIEKHVAAATMFDINKTIMRCLVKNLAMFGLGLYIYAGEDLPEDPEGKEPEPKQEQKQEQRDEPMTAAERAAAAYPSREEMISYIMAHTKIKRAQLDPLDDVKLMANFNAICEREAEKEKT